MMISYLFSRSSEVVIWKSFDITCSYRHDTLEGVNSRYVG